MIKDFLAERYTVDANMTDTITWLLQHQDCYESFHYDAVQQQLIVAHANGQDIICEGDYLNASYGILITAHNLAKP